MIKLIALLLLGFAQAPSRADIIAASRDIMTKAHFCTFITIGADGHPQARMVDPLSPDTDFTIWFATNPLTRKVAEIRTNPKVTMNCFDATTSSYVTVLGRATLVTDAAAKRSHWKADWDPIYPKGATSAEVVLVKITPSRLEIVSESRKMVGDPKTWRPLAIDFPGRIR